MFEVGGKALVEEAHSSLVKAKKFKIENIFIIRFMMAIYAPDISQRFIPSM